MAEKSRRELLADAFDKAEETEDAIGDSADELLPNEGEETPVLEQAGEEQEGQEGKAPLEGKEKEGKVDAKGKKEGEQTPDQKERLAAATEGKREPTPRTEGTISRAPNSWKPAEREAWAKVPPEARAAIARREKQIEETLSQTDNIRKFSGELARIVQPHMQNIQAVGGTPLVAIDTLLKTASSLMTGNKEQKANIIAKLIWENGVDVAALDATLVKGKPNEMRTNQDVQMPAWARPMFDFMNEAQQGRQRAQQQLQQDAQTEIESAQDMPFFDDMRQDIADVLEFAAKRGQVMSLQDGYKRALELRTDIKQIVTQRHIASRKSTDLASKKRAASSVRGSSPNGAPGSAKPASRREAISAAWDEAESR